MSPKTDGYQFQAMKTQSAGSGTNSLTGVANPTVLVNIPSTTSFCPSQPTGVEKRSQASAPFLFGQQPEVSTVPPVSPRRPRVAGKLHRKTRREAPGLIAASTPCDLAPASPGPIAQDVLFSLDQFRVFPSSNASIVFRKPPPRSATCNVDTPTPRASCDVDTSQLSSDNTSTTQVETSTPQVKTSTPQVETLTISANTSTTQVETSMSSDNTLTSYVDTSTPQVETSTPQVETLTPQVETSRSSDNTLTSYVDTSTPQIETSTNSVSTRDVDISTLGKDHAFRFSLKCEAQNTTSEKSTMTPAPVRTSQLFPSTEVIQPREGRNNVTGFSFNTQPMAAPKKRTKPARAKASRPVIIATRKTTHNYPLTVLTSSSFCCGTYNPSVQATASVPPNKPFSCMKPMEPSSSPGGTQASDVASLLAPMASLSISAGGDSACVSVSASHLQIHISSSAVRIVISPQ